MLFVLERYRAKKVIYCEYHWKYRTRESGCMNYCLHPGGKKSTVSFSAACLGTLF